MQARGASTTVPPGPPPEASTGISKFKRIASRFIVTATTKFTGTRAAFDIEANGLHDATKIHCIVIADLDSDRIDQYGPDQISAALEHLSRTSYLTGHNITGYDLPTLQRLHQWKAQPTCTIVDTMIAARLILPNLDDVDDEVAEMSKTKMGKLRGKYSLESFGMRLSIPKIGTDIDNFSTWTRELQQRCVADVVSTAGRLSRGSAGPRTPRRQNLRAHHR